MILKTRDFDDIEIDENDIISFQMPIFGFEEYSRFAFLYDDEISEHFVWLQSVDEPDLCFIIVDPSLVVEGYDPHVADNARRALGEGDLMSWLIVVIKEKFENSTVNLKSPIIVNPLTKKGAQIILEENYPIQHPLLSQKGGA